MAQWHIPIFDEDEDGGTSPSPDGWLLPTWRKGETDFLTDSLWGYTEEATFPRETNFPVGGDM